MTGTLTRFRGEELRNRIEKILKTDPDITGAALAIRFGVPRTTISSHVKAVKKRTSDK